MNASNANVAFPLLTRARELAPDFAPAYGLEAWCRTLWSYSPDESYVAENERVAVDLARRAFNFGGDDPELLGQIGYCLAFFEENIDLGRKLVRRGLDAAPSLAWLWGSQGFLTMFNSDMTEALAAFDTAQRLDPRDPLSYRINIGIGMANFLVGEDATALRAGLEALEQSPRNMAVLRIIIMSFVELGDEARAREYTQRLLTLRPDFRIGSWLDRHPVRHNAKSERIRESLRKAGLPD